MRLELAELEAVRGDRVTALAHAEAADAALRDLDAPIYRTRAQRLVGELRLAR